MAPAIASTVVDRPADAQVGTKCMTTRRIGGAIRATVDVTVEPLTETSSRLSTKGNASQRRSPEATRRGPTATAPGVRPTSPPGCS
jgi:hypothetical protein